MPYKLPRVAWNTLDLQHPTAEYTEIVETPLEGVPEALKRKKGKGKMLEARHALGRNCA